MKKLVKNCKKNDTAVIRLYQSEPGIACENAHHCFYAGQHCTNNWACWHAGDWCKNIFP